MDFSKSDTGKEDDIQLSYVRRDLDMILQK